MPETVKLFGIKKKQIYNKKKKKKKKEKMHQALK